MRFAVFSSVFVGFLAALASSGASGQEPPKKWSSSTPKITFRRLNRTEYNLSTRDLLGLDLRLADDFPADETGYGFDNIGELLSSSPLLVEKYLAAAEELARRATAIDVRPHIQRIDSSGLDGSHSVVGNAAVLFTQGALRAQLKAPREGEYALRVQSFGHQAGNEPVRMGVRLDGRDLVEWKIAARRSRPQLDEQRLRLTAGEHRLSLDYRNDFSNPLAPNPDDRDRNLLVEWVELVGPLDLRPEDLTERARRLYVVVPQAGREREAAREILRAFARRAYRRPIAGDEVERLATLFDRAWADGEPFERALQLPLQAALASPEFLFRIEQTAGPSADPLVNEHELATRLSYFLWSSLPDDELSRRADAGALRTGLRAEVARMLADPRSESLADHFAGQWLEICRMRQATPNPERFPQFSKHLARSMEEETKRFIQAVFAEGSVFDLLDARHTFVDESLARHYGIAGISGPEFRRVSLDGTPRSGLLTQASVLTLTSNPDRTSPVKRGKWVLEQLLGEPVQAPPPNVEDLAEEGDGPRTLRDRLEEHRASAACAACHARLDPWGLTLESFDAVGRFRTRDGGQPIDDRAELPDGTSLKGPLDLARRIREGYAAPFRRNLASRLLVYALGRGLRSEDQATVEELSATLEREGDRFPALVQAVVQSRPFQVRVPAESMGE